MLVYCAFKQGLIQLFLKKDIDFLLNLKAPYLKIIFYKV